MKTTAVDLIVTIDKFVHDQWDVPQWQYDEAISDLKEIAEKATPEKPAELMRPHGWACPDCGQKLRKGREYFCPKCGKSIDWEEERYEP